MHKFSGGEFIVMGIPAESVDDSTAEIIEKVQPAGFIVFARNIKTPHQLRALTDDLRLRVRQEPIITIDQEGGRVSRLKEFMTEPPSARQLAQRKDISLIERHGELTGKLLRLFGFNLDLAPVLDIEFNNENDNSLNSRSYGQNAEEVIRNATAFARSLSKEGILTCGKHFPGYSAAKVDPHHELPTVTRTREEMLQSEWIPFHSMLKVLDSLMIGHVSYPLIDPSEMPASLSPKMVRDMVRGEWRFDGFTVTDDLDMGAINLKYGSAEAAALALRAGNDVLLVCHNINAVPAIAEALKAVPDAIKEESYARIQKLRARLAPPTPFSEQSFKSLDAAVSELKERTLACAV
jgi:beta-N-acetylhexosaminidase